MKPMFNLRRCSAPTIVLTLCFLSAVRALGGSPSMLAARARDPICKQISEAISSASNVYYPLHPNYETAISHWASSSSQRSDCAVWPGSAVDVAKILQIVASTRTPFAVRGGGHTANPGFSSTTGVHIFMKRFSEVTYNSGDNTVVIGAGLNWDDVYAALEPHGVNVVGGRVTGVGVAGFTLGGGYSWKTNQYGLTVDTITAFELVKPNGDIVTVTENSDPELFFGLKGGGNNFGIVTKFTLKTHPQTQVWGGLMTFDAFKQERVAAAARKFFSEVTDPKASIIAALNTLNVVVSLPIVSVTLFYDGPSPPPGIFDDFLAISHLSKDIKPRSFVSVVQASPSNLTYGTRGAFHSVPILEYSEAVVKAILNESKFWGPKLNLKSGIFISYSIEGFLPNAHAVSGKSIESAAYPPIRSKTHHPFFLYFAWTIAGNDAHIRDAIEQSARRITDVARADGQDIDSGAIYPNYAPPGTPLEEMYDSNLGRLRALRAVVDPDRVMDLCGGWKF
ncbi:hypothetical protein HGRIS_007761 [Hohenbuehelia grisea]|uniref:FAD-binding PCMH-type domain-containing protein n=1 Tax=Hohenbuehelia grisea TaxID=104357 RepID=A0ABR3J5U7_9AGAR